MVEERSKTGRARAFVYEHEVHFQNSLLSLDDLFRVCNADEETAEREFIDSFTRVPGYNNHRGRPYSATPLWNVVLWNG